MSTRRKKQRKRGDEIKSRNDFAGPKPWQNGKQRRYGVGIGERGDEYTEKETEKEGGNEDTKKEIEKERGDPRTRRKKRTPLCFSH